jgi:ABC-type transporter Mla MlaB component
VEGDLNQKNLETMRSFWLDKYIDVRVSQVTISLIAIKTIDYVCMHHLIVWLTRLRINVSNISIKTSSRAISDILSLCQIEQWAVLEK